MEVAWEPGSGTLLELAERAGLAPDFNCRSGSCGTCKASINQGGVSYELRPTCDVRDTEVLLCCAVPAERPIHDSGPLIIDA
ncbi:MAG: 2Fe-2S iron-sulfur cluster-binding protein [Hyphomicrobiaceae bacterium]